MLKDITGIRLLGANFDKVTDILMLDTNEGNTRKNVKGCLLYGRNGAGKSTLAKAIKKAKGEIQDSIIQAEFLDVNNSPIILNEEENAKVFVFDEEYIDKNIKFREEGLDTIIMVGHQVKLEDEIKGTKITLDKIKNELAQKKEIISKIENPECLESPLYYIKKMRSALQGNSSWAGRDKTIKGNRQNTKVSDDTYKQFIELSTKETRDQLVIEFNDMLNKLQIAQNGDAIISEQVPILNIDYDENEITRLLETRIEKPLLSAREKYLLGLVQTGKTEQLTNMVDTFSNKNVHECPYCAQPVTEEYKENLIQSIQKILSKEVENIKPR
ncbi:AAA family ATPase [Holdemanella biformis]|uniref:AAA family ATPase n=1 Tax=Holdemanella biformis TaxID=1735 RepID=UPI0022393081|nr:AAA family ATPase [Holdemanella biformis]